MIELHDISGFEWDDGNSDKNYKKHKVSDKEAEEVFNSQPFIVLRTAYLTEERFQLFGKSGSRFLTIVYTIRSNRVRVISAREMSKKEREFYDNKIKEEEIKTDSGV